MPSRPPAVVSTDRSVRPHRPRQPRALVSPPPPPRPRRRWHLHLDPATRAEGSASDEAHD
ncbi:MAG: hypothetical protein WKF58_14835 [Ilumatobacteraceae bacterium]